MFPITRPNNTQGCQICNVGDHLAICYPKYANSKPKCNSKHLQMVEKLKYVQITTKFVYIYCLNSYEEWGVIHVLFLVSRIQWLNCP